MNDNVINDDLDKIEEELKEEESEEEKTHHKVSGKSVFELREIIAKRGIEASRGNSSGIIKKKSKKDGDESSDEIVGRKDR